MAELKHAVKLGVEYIVGTYLDCMIHILWWTYNGGSTQQ